MTSTNQVKTPFRLYTAKNVEQDLSEIPLLYHYTSWEAFLKIWQNASLWMSEIGWQNDKQEYRHGITVINEQIKRQYQPLIAKRWNTTDQYPSLATSEDLQRPPVYTFSLSEKPDLLSQWRGYCPGGGVCFAFRPQVLLHFIKKYKLLLAPCQYTEQNQQMVVDKFVFGNTPQEHLRDFKLSSTDPYERFESYFLHEVSLEGNVYAPFLKDYAFHEEAEWHLVACSQYLVDSLVPEEQLRSRGAELIPFVEYSFAGAVSQSSLDKTFARIIVGPGQTQTLAALQRQLYDKDALSIDPSKIPYRL